MNLICFNLFSDIPDEPESTDSPEHSLSPLPSTSNFKRSSSDSVAVTQDRLATATGSAPPSQFKKVRVSSTDKISITTFVVKTSKTEKVALDQQIANHIYVTNTPFRAVEHYQFIKMVRMLRPGYIPPNRYQVGGCFLDQSFSSVIDSYSEELKGENSLHGHGRTE